MTPLEQKLQEAEDALHALLLGQQARVITDQNGERVEFNAANRSALIAYIARLKHEIAGTSPSPVKVWFR